MESSKPLQSMENLLMLKFVKLFMKIAAVYPLDNERFQWFLNQAEFMGVFWCFSILMTLVSSVALNFNIMDFNVRLCVYNKTSILLRQKICFCFFIILFFTLF